MAISLTCDCGKRLSVKDEIAGKRVKCPGCGNVLTVPSLQEDAPPSREPARLDDLNDDAPARKKKRGKGGSKKSNKNLLIGAIAGVLLLSCCCVSAGTGGLWWFVLRSPGAPEKVMIGKWKFDVDAFKKNSTEKGKEKEMEADIAMMSAIEMEFKADYTAAVTFGGKNLSAKWKLISSKDKVATIEIKDDNKTAKDEWTRLEVTVIDSNHLKIAEKRDGKDRDTMYLKRL